MQAINQRGLVLIGCGFMGKALLQGWMANGISPAAIFVQDPSPSDWLKAQKGLQVNAPLPQNPAVIILATKPQVLDAVLPPLARFGNGTTVAISIAAGAPVSLFETHLGGQTPVIRAMPNLPASVGQGMTGLFASDAASDADLALAQTLFAAVGTSVTVQKEDMLHLVTGLSGSGPAYVFALAEAMAKAGETLGLPADLAKALAVQTVVGAGQMLAAPNASPTALRVAVTSKGGTTAAGLDQLMQDPNGLTDLVENAINAARKRSIELSQIYPP